MKKIIILITVLVAIVTANEHKYTELEKQYLIGLTKYDYKAVKTALEAGVDINLIDDMKQPPLIRMFSSIAFIEFDKKRNDKERIKIANYLINKGVDVNAIEKNGFCQRALDFAILNRYKSVIENMIKHGSKVDVDNKCAKKSMRYFKLDTNPPIFNVVKTKKPLNYLKYLISIRAGNLKSKSYNDNTLLHASLTNWLDRSLVKYLIGKFDINVKNKNGETPLMTLCSYGRNYLDGNTTREELIELLVKNGADAKLIYKETKDTTLQMALKFALEFKAIKALVESGVDINNINKNGYSALDIANYKYYNNDILDYLLQKGAKINDAHKLLRGAVIAKQINHVEYWAKRDKDINKRDKDGKTVLNIALENSFSDIARVLKEHSAKATSKTELEKIVKKQKNVKKDKITNIYKAIKLHNLTKVKEFFENNSTLEEKKFNLAMSSVSYGNLEALKYFLSKGAKIDGIDKEGYNLLQQAVFKDQLKIIKFLLNKGLKLDNVKPNTVNNYILSATTSVKTFKYLQEQGLKPKDKTEKDKLIKRALRRDNPKLVLYLLKNGYTFDKKLLNNDSFLSYLIEKDRAKSIKFLIGKGLDVNRATIWGKIIKSPMILLSLKLRAYKVAKVLINNKAKIVGVTNSNHDYVHTLAVGLDRIDIIEALLKNGFDINYHDCSKPFSRTMLEEALKDKNVKIVKFLLNHNANYFGVCKGNNNLLIYPVDEGFVDITKTLIKKGANPYIIFYNSQYGYFNLLDIAKDNKDKAMQEYLKTLNITPKKIVQSIYKKYKKGKEIRKEIYAYMLKYYLPNEPEKISNISKYGKSSFDSFKTILKNEVCNALYEAKDLNKAKQLVKVMEKHKIEDYSIKVMYCLNEAKIFEHFLKQHIKKDKKFINSKKAYDLAYHLVKYGQYKKLKVLIDNGISLKTRNASYPIWYAVNSKNYNSNVIKVLLQSDMDFSQKNANGYTAIELAIMKNNTELFDMLLPKSKKVPKRDIFLAYTKANKKMQEHFLKKLNLTKESINNLMFEK